MIKKATSKRVKINLRMDAETKRRCVAISEYCDVSLNEIFMRAVQEYLLPWANLLFEAELKREPKQ
jgi:predicted HicB family RNase H-like nuclease